MNLDNMPDVFYNTILAKEQGYKHIVNQGGTWSSKTFNNIINLFLIAIREPNASISVTGRSIPFLKRGALLDCKNILSMPQYKEIEKHIKTYNKSERVYHFKNGSFIEFPIFQTEGDARGGKRDYLFLNEADSIDYEIAQQLIIRTNKAVFYDYNPSAPFWVHDKIIPREDCKLIISDHRGNQFLTQDKHDEIENHPDDEWWRVYARGMTGNITGLCFPNWKPIHGDDWKKDIQETIWGGDFGFTSSKTAIVKIHILSKTEVVIEEVYYKADSDDQTIFDVCMAWGYNEHLSYWDHNSTDRGGKHEQYVSLLRNRGMQAYLAIKAGKSQQIGMLRKVQIWYTPNSENVAAERARYRFKTFTDNEGNKHQLNQIEDGTPNHLMDAIQYGIYTHFYRNGYFI